MHRWGEVYRCRCIGDTSAADFPSALAGKVAEGRKGCVLPPITLPDSHTSHHLDAARHARADPITSQSVLHLRQNAFAKRGCVLEGATTSNYLLNVPEEVYAHARRVVEETSQPVDQVMIEYLRMLSAPLPTLSPDEEAELEALKNLSGDALWTIAREQMPGDLQARMQDLMDRNSRGTVTPGEYTELEGLVERGQRLMVRKSQAAALLTQRGYKVTPKDMMARE